MKLSDGRTITADCKACTTPVSSGEVSVKLADAIHAGRHKVT